MNLNNWEIWNKTVYLSSWFCVAKTVHNLTAWQKRFPTMDFCEITSKTIKTCAKFHFVMNLFRVIMTVDLAIVSTIFLLIWLVYLTEHVWNKEKCFLFHFQSSFHYWDNQILNFLIFKCHDVIKCVSMKQETHFIE